MRPKPKGGEHRRPAGALQLLQLLLLLLLSLLSFLLLLLSFTEYDIIGVPPVKIRHTPRCIKALGCAHNR